MKLTLIFSLLSAVSLVVAAPASSTISTTVVPQTTSSTTAATTLPLPLVTKYANYNGSMTTGQPVLNTIVDREDDGEAFQFNKPVDNQTYTLGYGAQLLWRNGIASNIVISVFEGDNPNNMQPTQYNANVSAGDGEGSFSVPISAMFEDKKTYCFVIKYTKNGKSYKSYSHTFKVNA